MLHCSALCKPKTLSWLFRPRARSEPPERIPRRFGPRPLQNRQDLLQNPRRDVAAGSLHRWKPRPIDFFHLRSRYSNLLSKDLPLDHNFRRTLAGELPILDQQNLVRLSLFSFPFFSLFERVLSSCGKFQSHFHFQNHHQNYFHTHYQNYFHRRKGPCASHPCSCGGSSWDKSNRGRLKRP